jgi:hypothetical protein
MQAWHTPEDYDVGCPSRRRKLEGMCHYTHLSPQERDCIAELCGTREAPSAISRQRSARTAPASAASSRGTHGTDTLGHALPKRRADERRRRCRAKSDPTLAQKVRLLIMDRHWSPEEIDDISGSRVATSASLSLPTILTGRSRLPPSTCRDLARKARCGATCAGRGSRSAARGLRPKVRSRSYTA